MMSIVDGAESLVIEVRSGLKSGLSHPHVSAVRVDQSHDVVVYSAHLGR